MTASNVVPIRRCKCGKPARRLELCFQDEPIGSFSACSECLAEMTDLLDRVRPVFDAMTAVGIDQEKANETMTYLLGLMDQ